MATITITIGLNSNRTLQPLPMRRREQFRDAVRLVLRQAGATVFVDGAQSTGTWIDAKTHTLVREASRTWVADVPDPQFVANLLPDLCELYEQDAIAFTVGTTELVAGRQPVPA